MQHSPLGPIHAAVRVFLLEWFTIALVLPAIALGLGRLAGISTTDIWHNVILAPHNLLIVPLTIAFARRVWFGYKFEGAGQPRRRRDRAA